MKTLLLILLLPSFALSQIDAVWAVDEGVRVKKTKLGHPMKTSENNPVWDGDTIYIFGGRNEIVGFQVIIEAGASGVDSVRVTLDTLASGENLITNAGWSGDPMDYVGRRIEFFVAHYDSVYSRSDVWNSPNAGFEDAVAKPDSNYLGWIPDFLVPAEADSIVDTGQGGYPFTIAGSRSQSVWCDVYIPSGQTAGTYTGTLRVTEGGRIDTEVPVQLKVYGFTLSDTTHCRVFMYDDGAFERHVEGVTEGDDNYWAITQNYMNTFHRHRMTLQYKSVTIDTFKVRVGGYYTGAWYDTSRNYEGPGRLTGEQTYAVGIYDQGNMYGGNAGYRSGFWPDNESSWRAAMREWVKWFSDSAANVLYFKYMLDEPPRSEDVYEPGKFWNDSLNSIIREKGGWIKDSMHTFCTSRVDTMLTDGVTIFCLPEVNWTPIDYRPEPDIPAQQMGPSDAAKALKDSGDIVSWYGGSRPHSGSVEWLDNELIDNRINPWLMYKYDLEPFFIWNIGYLSGENFNVWSLCKPPSLNYWGLGEMVHAGKDVKFPGEDRDVDGPIMSMRLKNLRRGIQDFEYFYLASQLGVPEDSINTIINEIIGYAWWFRDYDQTTDFSQLSYEYEANRERMAVLLESYTEGGTPPAAETIYRKFRGRKR